MRNVQLQCWKFEIIVQNQHMTLELLELPSLQCLVLVDSGNFLRGKELLKSLLDG